MWQRRCFVDALLHDTFNMLGQFFAGSFNASRHGLLRRSACFLGYFSDTSCYRVLLCSGFLASSDDMLPWWLFDEATLEILQECKPAAGLSRQFL
jgi:hypothetical protein